MPATDRQAKSLFLEAVEKITPDQWPAYLEAQCHGNTDLLREVEGLLHAHAAADSLLDGHGSEPTLEWQPPCESPGTRIGPYKLREQIGEGGFGVVYVAEQEQPVARKVALKIIKPGMDTREVIARFESERQALAMMDHPYIAKVLDAGTTGLPGRPYFVMELVKGVPITDFCDAKQLSTRERLELFVDTCRAVQHAHHKGIIHRDLKPSNIMVALHDDRPVVKVIDFGIAKVLSRKLTEKTIYTAYGQMIGTPAYMSPEQAQLNELDVDTRSDVYSLGVLLYELLTGTTPFDVQTLKNAGFEELRRIIREDDPPRPSARVSTLNAGALLLISSKRHMEPQKFSRSLHGELDWIVMKSLEKNRNRRYETAAAFAGDVQRFLNDEPVQACPPSAGYRFRKFARRHRAALTTTLIVGLALLLTVGSLVRSVTVLADSNAQIHAEQEQTEEALGREKQTNDELSRALLREQRILYFQRIAVAERELAANNVGRAEELLDDCPLELRGWEWHYLRRRRQQEPFVFRGHRDGILGLAFSPDGKYLASGSATLLFLGEIQIWDRVTGKVRHRLLGHTGPVVGLAYSPDGQHLASAGWDQTVKVWETATGKELCKLRGHSEYASCVAFSPDGKFLVSGSGDRTVKVWDAITFQELHTLKGHAKGIYAVAFHPNGKALAVGSGEGSIKLWDMALGQELQTLTGHAGPVLGLAYSRDGKRIASSGFDGTAKVWDAEAGRHALTLRAHFSLATCVAFSQDGQRLAVGGGWEKAVQIWDLGSGQEALTLRGHQDMVMSVAFSPDGQQLASCGLDGTVILWDSALLPSAQNSNTLTLRGHTGIVVGVAYSSDGKRLASGSLDETVRLWDPTTGEEIRALVGHVGPVAAMGFSHDGQLLATADCAGSVKLWETTTGKTVRSLPGFGSVAITADGQRVAFALEGAIIHIRDTATGKEILPPFQAHLGPIHTLAFSPDGRQLASGSWDRTANIWDATTGQRLHTLYGHTHVIHSIAFSGDGQRLATASWDKTAKVWDATTGKELLTLQGHEDRVLTVAFSVDGKYLVTASWDNSVKIWNTLTGKNIATLRGHTGQVTSAAFSPDGRQVAVGSGYRGKGEVKFWDALPWEETTK